jgi:hypothetical protein
MIACRGRYAGRRMLRNKILSKSRWSGFDCVRFGHGVTGCIGLAYGLAQVYLCAEARRQMVLHIALPDLARGDSSGSVAYLKDARLERSLECQRREGKNGLLFQAYAYPSPRADGLSCRHGQRFASGTSAMFSTTTMPQRNDRENGRVGISFSSMPARQHSVSNP